MKRSSLSLLLLLMASCTTTVPTPTTTLAPIKQEPSRLTETKTIEVQTASPRAPSITPSPAQTPITSVDHIDLPDWLGDPDTTVAMMVTDVQGTEVKLSILNLPTEEFFHIPISTEEIRGYFWMPDGKQFGLLLSGFREILLIDTSSGNITQKSILKEALRFIDLEREYLLHRLEVSGSVLIDETDFFFLPRSPSYSFDQEFIVDQFFDEEENPIAIQDTQTGEMLFKTAPGDGLHDISPSWSPTANFLALLQFTERPLDSFAPGDRILLLNQNGQLVKKFFGNFLRLRWSPDGTKIMYREVVEEEGNGPISRYPCILDMVTGEQSCIKQILSSHSPFGGRGFRWSASGESILYVTHTEDASRLCMFDVQRLVEHCPSEGWEEPENPRLGIGGFSTSPDEKYIIFGFPECAEFCHYFDESQISILRIDGCQYFSLGFETHLLDQFFFYPRGSLLWRPFISP